MESNVVHGGGKRFAAMIINYRKDAGLTQTELAQLTGVKREYISSIELGRIAVIYPETFNELHRVLRFPAFAGLEAMGFVTDASERDVNPALLSILKEMDSQQQSGVLTIVKAMLRGGEDIHAARSA